MDSRVQCSFVRSGVYGTSWGRTLTVIRSAECVAALKTTTRPAVILPLLVILFIVSYGILTMLVFEQGKTIESQRSLIREMLKDSTQLATLKGKLARDDSKRSHDKASAPGGAQRRRIPAMRIPAIRRQGQKERTKKQNDPVNRPTPRRKLPGGRPRIWRMCGAARGRSSGRNSVRVADRRKRFGFCIQSFQIQICLDTDCKRVRREAVL